MQSQHLFPEIIQVGISLTYLGAETAPTEVASFISIYWQDLLAFFQHLIINVLPF